jgi:hypothetical protein
MNLQKYRFGAREARYIFTVLWSWNRKSAMARDDLPLVNSIFTVFKNKTKKQFLWTSTGTVLINKSERNG